jgi:hypothetical protein
VDAAGEDLITGLVQAFEVRTLIQRAIGVVTVSERRTAQDAYLSPCASEPLKPAPASPMWPPGCRNNCPDLGVTVPSQARQYEGTDSARVDASAVGTRSPS